MVWAVVIVTFLGLNLEPMAFYFSVDIVITLKNAIN